MEVTSNTGFFLNLERSKMCKVRYKHWASLVAQTVKNMPAMQEMQVRSLGQEDPLEKEVTTHSSIFAWEIS